MKFYKTQKILSATLIMIMLLSLINAIFKNDEVQADSNRYTYTGSNLNTSTYAGYKDKLDALKKAHPNWTFVIMETGLSWSQTITAEASFAGSSPYSLIPYNTGEWICSTCGYKAYDNGSWYHPSEKAIAYYMDPRNWLDDNAYLFQFLQLDYIETSDDAVYKALNGTFLYSMENAKTINDACRNLGINAYYVIARIMQEQTTKGSATYKMTDSNGTVYYNLFNIGATGNGNSQIIANALSYAKSKNWTSVKACIQGGTETLLKYIKSKQNTLYLQKFDVETYGGTYSNQYMQNLMAPYSESSSMYSKLKTAGLLDTALTFVIPVYNGMSSSASAMPSSNIENGPINIKLKSGVTNYNVRSGRSQNDSIVTTVANSDTIVLSTARYNDGWYRVVLTDGNAGYVYYDSAKWETTSDVSNCNEYAAITGDSVALRAGPGTSETVLKYLNKGQVVTRIDKGRYTINNITWDRIFMNDGTQGFVSTDYVDANAAIYTITASSLNMRSSPGTSGAYIRTLSNGSKVTRLEIGTTEIDGYYWDKVITGTGITGYVARTYLVDVNGNVATGTDVRKTSSGTTSTNTSSELAVGEKDTTNKTITVEPNVTVKQVLEKYSNAAIKNASGTALNSNTSTLICTGDVITIDGVAYTAVKMGDVNGDGKINSADLLKIQKHLLNVKTLTTTQFYAADVSGDAKINSADLLRIQKYLLGTKAIEI